MHLRKERKAFEQTHAADLNAEHAAMDRHKLEEKQAAQNEEFDRTDDKNAPVTRDSLHATVRSILTSQGQSNS